MFLKISAVLTTTIVMSFSPAVFADVLIDGFHSGKTTMKHKCGIKDNLQRANVLGKYRWIRQQINKCQDGKRMLTQVKSGQLVGINNVSSRTEIHYGRLPNGKQSPMNLDFYKGKFNLRPHHWRTGPGLALKLSANKSLNLNVGLGASKGKRASCGINIPAGNQTVYFSTRLLRRVNGMKQSDFRDIDYLTIILQSVGNFNLHQIKAVDKPPKSAIKASGC